MVSPLVLDVSTRPRREVLGSSIIKLLELLIRRPGPFISECSGRLYRSILGQLQNASQKHRRSCLGALTTTVKAVGIVAGQYDLLFEAVLDLLDSSVTGKSTGGQDVEESLSHLLESLLIAVPIKNIKPYAQR